MCTGLVCILYRFPELKGKGIAQAWVDDDAYETHPILGESSPYFVMGIVCQWSVVSGGVAGGERTGRRARSEKGGVKSE